MAKTIKFSDFDKFELKSGMIVALRSTNESDNPEISNMVIFESGSKMYAIETLWKNEEVVTDPRTGNNYCIIDRKKYPGTLGINPIFGDKVDLIFDHLGICDDDEVVSVIY